MFPGTDDPENSPQGQTVQWSEKVALQATHSCTVLSFSEYSIDSYENTLFHMTVCQIKEIRSVKRILRRENIWGPAPKSSFCSSGRRVFSSRNALSLIRVRLQTSSVSAQRRFPQPLFEFRLYILSSFRQGN